MVMVHQQFSVERLKPLVTIWVPVRGVDESIEGVEKAFGKFCPNRWKKPFGFFPYQLKVLRKAVGKFCPSC